MDPKTLRGDITQYLKEAEVATGNRPIALIAPHAGYIYSGGIAAHAYKRIASAFQTPPTFVILCPNHTGNGIPLALSALDWGTPLGTVKLDRDLANAIKKNSHLVDFNEEAHAFEHSAEVQLPFLQALYKDFKFVPLCMMTTDPEEIEEVGRAVFKASEELKRNTVVIASSDFTHYEAAESAKKKDSLALEDIKKLDYKGFLKTVDESHISICGFAPIATAMVYSKLANASFVELLKYGNSGETTGESGSVVAYASLAITV